MAMEQNDNSTAVLNGGVETITIPVVEEFLQVERRIVETGGARIVKIIRERTEIVDEPLMAEEVTVERVPVNRPVDGAVAIRYVGDTMIVPLLEEVIVTEKRLILKEELHITRRQTTTRKPQEVILRTEEAVVERMEPVGLIPATERTEAEESERRNSVATQ